MKRKNPFVVVGYDGPETFCDRVNETARIIEAVENGRNVTLIAPRRYGKTGLIHHAFGKLSTEMTCVYLDIFATKNLTEFTRMFASAIVGAGGTPTDRTLTTVARFFRNCRPTVIPMDDGRPKFSFDVVQSNAEATLQDAFSYLKRGDRPIVVAIDEFQQILSYPEQGTEALLRGFIQEVPSVRFVFAGSRHHLMGKMFLSAKHPFYQSTDMLSLGVIDRAAYSDFARGHFERDGQSFQDEVFAALYGRFSGVTWYVQSVLNRIWLRKEGLVDAEQVEAVVHEQVQDRALVFRDLFFSQSEASQSLLSAIACEREAREVFSADFLGRYGLKSASTVRSALNSLIDSDLVYRTETGYVVYDRLFSEWLRTRQS